MVNPVVRALLEFLIIFSISLFAYYFLLYTYKDNVFSLLQGSISSYDALALKDIIDYYAKNCPGECFIEISYPNFLKGSFLKYTIRNNRICFFIGSSKLFCQNASNIYVCESMNEDISVSLKIKNNSIDFLKIC